jgi:hypothetical protein
MNALTVSLLLAGAPAAEPYSPHQSYYPAGANPYFAPAHTPSAPASAYQTDLIAGGVQDAAPHGAAPNPAAPPQPQLCDTCTAPARGLFRSDRAFENFVGPISNPILSKDPRSNTYARILFVNNNVPAGHPLHGNIQAYGLQVNLALTERLSFIADKDGAARIAPRNGPSTTGFLNIAAGLKYAFLRDVENQRIAAVGFQYEVPSGEAKVQQNHGAGAFSVFLTGATQVREHWHVLNTAGYYFPLQNAQGSSFFYNTFHIDRKIGWFVPLAELNWFWYTSGGNRLPPAFGEGDGLLNLGTRGQAGAHLVTAAFGAKALLGPRATAGCALEVPLSNRNDFINQRLLVELILRY